MIPRIYIAMAAAVLIGGAVAWSRIDAANDEQARIKAAGDAARLSHIEGAKDETKEIDNLGGDALCDELGRMFGSACAR